MVKNGVSLDNRWVVPYNPALLKKFQAHINVEWCNKTYLIKYLFKYINKGSDSTMFVFSHRTSEKTEAHTASNGGIDEVMQHIKSRYLSTCELFWRLYGFEIHGRSPSVERLIVHLPNMQFVTYHDGADLEEVIEDPDSSRTMLTEWFATNQRHIFARDLTYCEFPTKFSWDPEKKVWTKRKRGTKIGRLKHIHPSTGEPFYLRMLLMIVRGCMSFEDIRTYEGVLYGTYREACQARGLIGDDAEWDHLFEEAVIWATSYQLRNLFMTVLAHCDVGDVRVLFDKYWRYMVDDFAYKLTKALGVQRTAIPEVMLQDTLLKELDAMFSNNGLSISSYNLPTPVDCSGSSAANRLILEEL